VKAFLGLRVALWFTAFISLHESPQGKMTALSIGCRATSIQGDRNALYQLLVAQLRSKGIETRFISYLSRNFDPSRSKRALPDTFMAKADLPWP
jgi:hypothetical protein